MTSLVRAAGGLLFTLALVSCGGKQAVTSEPQANGTKLSEAGVSRELARDRSARLENIVYRLRFDIPEAEANPIPAQLELGFDLSDTDAPLLLDFRAPPGSVLSLRVNGVDVEPRLLNEHILLPVAQLREGRNQINIAFTAGESSLNRNPDFLYTLFVPDRARTAFPVFDQPDLKARYELTLSVPDTWQALANATLEQAVELEAGRREYRFTPSDPISSYLFSFVAGEFQAITRDVNGLSMTMLHRETDAAKVARNADAIFELHAKSLDWLEDYTGIAYPFQKFDFVLIPDFPYSGMEHVGAIQYRAEELLLDEQPPLTDLLGRAQLITHETAHMWFGNLVTMRWFDDVWTKEVFANLMADKLVHPAFPGIEHTLNFQVNHYPGAYSVDRSEGANPIRQMLPNLNQAGSLYGAIIYDKAPIMMRQLELIVGEDGLRAGLQEYLHRFSYGNAAWPDLIAILDTRSELDLAAWSEVWVNTSGRPRYKLATAADGALQLLQEDPAGLERVWPQQFDLLRLTAEGQEQVTLAVNRRRTMLPTPIGIVEATLYNADGRGYGLFPADLDVLRAWERLLPVQRAAAMINTFENLLDGNVADPRQHFMLLLGIVKAEQDPLLLELALRQLSVIYQSLIVEADALTPQLEETLWTTTLAQPDAGRTKLVFRYCAQLVSSPAMIQQLYSIWRGTRVIDRLILEEQDRVELAEILAIRLPDNAGEIVAEQLAALRNPDRRRRLEFIGPSLSGDPAERDAFFESLRNEQNRQTEIWVLDALRNLHHPSRLAQSEHYLLPSLELVEEVQATGDIFFPTGWLYATLENHYSASAAQTVRRFLTQRPGYNPQLRMKILQAADRLFRAVAIRARQSGG